MLKTALNYLGLIQTNYEEIMKDNINPQHYRSQPVECIEITHYMDFLLGNAFKYVWRHKEKNGSEDLNKALWYVNRAKERCEVNIHNVPGGFKNLDLCLFSAVQYQTLRRILIAYENNSVYGERIQTLDEIELLIKDMLDGYGNQKY